MEVPLPLRIAPLPSYAGAFTAWRGELVVGDRKAPDGCVAPSEGALMLAGRGESNTTLGQIVGTSRQLVGMWSGGLRFPADEHLATMEAKLGIPAVAWQLWRSSAPAAAPEPPPPAASKRREGASEPPAPASLSDALPGSEGTVLERAERLLEYLAVRGKTSDELAQAREIRHAITLAARLAGAMRATSKAKLHDHPDWKALIDALVTALAPVPSALDTLEAALTKFAEAREE